MHVFVVYSVEKKKNTHRIFDDWKVHVENRTSLLPDRSCVGEPQTARSVALQWFRSSVEANTTRKLWLAVFLNLKTSASCEVYEWSWLTYITLSAEFVWYKQRDRTTVQQFIMKWERIRFVQLEHKIFATFMFVKHTKKFEYVGREGYDHTSPLTSLICGFVQHQ